MHTETLTIGQIATTLEYAPGTKTHTAWDSAHQAFVHPTLPAGATLAARLRVCSGPAPAEPYDTLLADGRLWTLHGNTETNRQRIVIHGCPAGPLAMVLDLGPVCSMSPLQGTLYLGPAPSGQSSVPLGYPLMPLLWTILLGRFPTEAGGLLCHACGIVTPDGDGLLFAGFSGAGKSTTSRLWRQFCPEATVLSDDRLVLRRDSDSPTGWTIHGTPWHGDAEEANPGQAPLTRILVLGRSPDGIRNQCVPLSPAPATAQLLTPPIGDRDGTQAALALASDAARSLPMDRWDFAPNAQAVHTFRA
jgi:hypothetical protein